MCFDDRVEKAHDSAAKAGREAMAVGKLRQQSAEEAAVALARLFSAHCRVDINPPDLQAMLTAHWSKVAALAHAIHGSEAGTGPIRDRPDWRP